MAYPTADTAEREQVEWVFSLTGGELEDKPLRYAYVTHNPGLPRMAEKWARSYADEVQRGWFRYHYDGAPEYAERELRNLSGELHTVVTCAIEAPPRTIYARGKRWRLVRTFQSSGETECPGRTLHECLGHEEHPTATEDGHKVSVVTAGESHLAYEGAEQRECRLCSAYEGEPHGFIYLGDGWVEAVYYSRG